MIAKRNFSRKNPPKGISPERLEELIAWAYKIWDIHWIEDAPVSNNRAGFLNYILRDHEDLDDKTLKQIELSVQAFTEYLKAKKAALRPGERLTGVQTLQVWYNQGVWDQEFIDESTASLKERAQKKYCQCGREVDIGPAGQCIECYSKRTENKQNHKKNLTDLGLYSPGQSLSELSKNCREYLRQNGGSKKLLAQMTSSKPQPKPGNQ